MISPASLPALQRALGEHALDGWLLFDFQASNPIALGLLGLNGMLTRRHMAYVPAHGVPTALVPAIEPWPWSQWPTSWNRQTYGGWSDLEAALRDLVGGQRIAMEYSPGNSIPHLDRVPAGAVDMLRHLGADVVSSAELVTAFFAVWSAEQLASHRRSAAILAGIAQEAQAVARERAGSNTPISEHALREWLVMRMSESGLVSDSLPIVAAGANSADVHYIPSADRPHPIVEGDVLLVDLWAKEPNGVYADQTWMATIGSPSARVRNAWEAVRAARDGALDMMQERVRTGEPLRGAEVHRHALSLLTEHGFGTYAVGRAGHSIDQRQLHGAGPNLDAVESRDDRLLIPGTACSVEPGVYLPREFGIRSEVNVYIDDRSLVITPEHYQRELTVL